MKVLNENVAKPLGKFIKNEIIDIQRNKIKAEYHYSPSYSGTSKIERSSDLNVRRIEFSSKEFSPNKPSLREQLKQFAQKHNPSTDMFEDMLQIMHSNGVQVPRDVNSVFEPTMEFDIISMSFGNYLNIGLMKNIQSFIKPHLSNTIPEHLELDIAIYMIKSKPDENELKPPHHLIILGRFVNIALNEPFVIGIYKGAFPSLTIGNQILKPLCDELKYFEESEIEIENKKIQITPKTFICDPLANSIVTCTSLPSSINGCSKCNQQGTLQFNHGITSYPAANPSGYERDDDDFKICIQNGHHIGVPILNERNIQLVSQFAIDYKNLLCDGVMKTLVRLWTKGRLDYRINNRSMRRISAELMLISKSCPSEFRNKPKTMDEIHDWTSYDWRQFLIYYGPIVLKTELPQKYYVHFLHLHLGMRLLLSKYDFKECSIYVAGQLLNTFVSEFSQLYGADLVDYDIHNLLHLEDTTVKLGVLENIGGFMFDKQFNLIESLIQDDFNVNLADMGKSILENTKNIFENQINEMKTKNPHVTSEGNLVMDDFILTNSEPDNHFFTDNGHSVVKIEDICCEENQIEIVGRVYETNVMLYQSAFGQQKMILISELSETRKFTIDDVTMKAFKVDTARGTCVLPLLTL